MSKQDNKIGSGLLTAWHFAITNWRMLVLLYAVNSLFAYLLLTPIRLGLSRALDHRLTPDTINFTLLSDLLSNQSLLLNGQLGLILFGLIAHLLWLVFATAGITHSVIEVTNSLRDFWIGGYRLFWRFLRLTTYTLLIFGGILFIAVMLFNFGETNIFMIESEEIFTRRLTYLVPLISLLYTFVKLWNDTLKLNIARSEQTWFFREALKTWRKIFNWKLIAVFIINICIVLLLAVALLTIKSIINGQVAIIFAISQVLLLVRLTYKVANLKAIDIMIDVKTKVQRNSA